MGAVRLGTRGSQLARAQAAWVADHLATGPGIGAAFDTVVIATAGDRPSGVPLGTGVFVKELQGALLDGRIDIAVHSLKDLPTDPTPGLVVAAIPERADPRDALVGGTLQRLASGATVGTGSPRRSAQLRRLRPDLEVVPIRGNIPTRIAKARRGAVAAVMVAAAGLERLSLPADELLDTDAVLPAPGQGALAIEIRTGDPAIRALVGQLDHAPTRAAVVAERAVLRELGGGCLLPVATLGRLTGGSLVLEASVTAVDGSAQALARAEGDPLQPEQLGAQVARQLIEFGALDLLGDFLKDPPGDLPAQLPGDQQEDRRGDRPAGLPADLPGSLRGAKGGPRAG